LTSKLRPLGLGNLALLYNKYQDFTVLIHYVENHTLFINQIELFNLNRVIVNLLCYWHNCDFDRYRRVINLSLPNKSGFNKFTLQMYNKNKFMKKSTGYFMDGGWSLPSASCS
jgi:hypothetical protein